MVDLGPLELATTGRRRAAREVIRQHDELLAIRLDRYDPIPPPLDDPIVQHRLDIYEEKIALLSAGPLRPSPMEVERR